MTPDEQRELVATIDADREVTLEWAPSEDVGSDKTRLERRVLRRYLDHPDSWLLELAFGDARVQLSLSLAFWRDFAAELATKLRRIEDIEEQRTALPLTMTDAELLVCLDAMPLMPGAEYVDLALLRREWERLTAAFTVELAKFSGTVEQFIHSFNPDVHLAGRVYFHLVENSKGAHPFAFMATYSTRVAGGRSRHVPLKFALKEFAGQQERLLELLSTVYAAGRESELIADLIDSGELFHPLAWNADEAYQFLKEVPLYETAGVLCRIPNWWKAKTASVSLQISLGDKQPSRVGLEAMTACAPALEVDGAPISPEEIRRLLQETEGLAFLKNRWVPVDPEKLRQTLAAYEEARELLADGLSLRDAIRLQINPESVLGDGDVIPQVSNGEWLQEVLQRLRQPETLDAVATGPDFRAELRPYQQEGLRWLRFLQQLGFGACLADDMGLGKTIQVLAFLDVLKRNTPQALSLLVVPASLLGNWRQEAARFLPGLRIYGAHPSLQEGGRVSPLKKTERKDWDLVITTYSLTYRYDWLREIHWTTVILDEAQAVKNPATRQARAVKQLPAEMRIALTGTPIENRLGDLWSLFDFLNPGLLGTRAEFKRFGKGIADRPNGYAPLRRVVMPYILRRLKTDRRIIADLPDKVEMKAYAELSKKQVVLYNRLTAELLDSLERLDGIQRRGLVLGSLMKFKQLCNHPDQYLGQHDYDPAESGKFQRLREICEIVADKRERVLVFTQFKELTQPLHDYLEGIFGRPGLVLHGSVAVGKRRKMVDRFQGRDYVPFMILSIKAGGVGLNLTKANHVVHFDRWWNPAVENQATDRAFRIGQQKDVLVHKFVTKGTIEERIDQMIAHKNELADEVVGASGEQRITEMNNRELKEMFTLSLTESP